MEGYELTRDAIRMLRCAKGITVFHHAMGCGAQVHVYDQTDNGDPALVIECNDVVRGGELLSARAARTHCHQDGQWQAFVRVLRPGDRLTVVWRIGNDSDVLREAGLTQDMCLLRVWRTERNRNVSLEFLLDTTIAPVDSSVRMCEPMEAYRTAYSHTI
ncbi:hypothetical protein D6833_07175 [Candidatus Parcubacteria bacterium]|nr:MAG: hypothetical protein D6833_07175 [Candidatus Parcubacteria bacterium]